MSTFFCFLNVNAQMYAVTNHAVRLGRCVGFVTHDLVILLEINGLFSSVTNAVTCLVRNSGIQKTER